MTTQAILELVLAAIAVPLLVWALKRDTERAVRQQELEARLAALGRDWVRFRVTVTDALTPALQRMARAMADMQPAMQRAGEAMAQAMREMRR